MTQWRALLEKAFTGLRSLEASGLKFPDWTMGGGTALMLQLEHRASKDIDLFIDDAQYLGMLSPRLAGEGVWGCRSFDETSHYLKLRYPEGEIDVIVAPPLTMLSPIESAVRGDPRQNFAERVVLLDHPVEIALKKLIHRGANMKVRDAFDLCVVHEAHAELLLANLPAASSKKQLIIDQIDRIRPDYAKAELAELDIFPRWRGMADGAMAKARGIVSAIPDA